MRWSLGKRVLTAWWWPLGTVHLCACVLVFLAVPVLAASSDLPRSDTDEQSQLKQLSLEQLSQIEVTTVSKEPEEAFRTPAAIYVITSEDIRRSGVTAIPEALRLAPGVEVARIDSDKWSVGIRGFGSRLCRNVLVLIDGRTVYTTLLAGTYWEVQDTVLEDIDRIEVIRGPGGTIWGPNAVDGVINIITKKVKDTQGLLLSGATGNLQRGVATARYGGTDGGNLQYRFYGKGVSRGSEYHWDNRNFDSWYGGQGGGRVDWQPDSRDAFIVQGDFYDQRDGESVVATSYTPPYQQVIDADARLSGGNLTARWTRNQGDNRSFELQLYYERDNRREPNFADLRDTYDVDFTQHWRLFSFNNITWGLGARFSHGHDLVVVSGLTFDPSERTDRLLTAFVQDEITLVPKKLSLTIGTKLLNTNFTSFAPEPSARVMWTPTNSTAVWAAATHAVRTPSDAERDFYLSGFIGIVPLDINNTIVDLPLFARFNANRKFRPEQMNGYELGVRQLLAKRFYIDIAAFLDHYHDLFSEDITGGLMLEDNPPPLHLLLPAQFGNGLLGQTKGIEVAPEWRPSENWRLRLSYSFLHMNLEKSPGSLDIGTIPSIVGSSPEHQVYAGSEYDLTKSLQFDFDYRYVSDLPAQMPISTVPNYYVRAYSTADARFGWKIRPTLDLSFVGRNLLSPHHPEFASDPAANSVNQALVGIKRSAYVQLTWTSSR